MTREPALVLAKLVAEQYVALPQVEAAVLAGSRTTELYEVDSDIDLYVYYQTEIPIEARRMIAETSTTRIEVDNRFWEPGDEWVDEATGIHVDVMFRQMHWIEEQLDRVLERHEASIGYSTCFWHNVLTSRPLIDKHGWFAALQTRARQPYPETLRRNIVAKNYPILRENLSSYLHQISNAVRRHDAVSLNHRITALLASYFDILFAVNRLPHPGEKRIVQIAEARCGALPEAMRAQVDKVLASGDGDIVKHVNALIDGLDTLLQKEELLAPNRDAP